MTFNNGHLQMTEAVKSRVLSVSPATFDRVLRKKRIKQQAGWLAYYHTRYIAQASNKSTHLIELSPNGVRGI